jgi:hypothetical protein
MSDKDHKLAIGTYVSVRVDRNWYPGEIVRFDGGFVVIRRTGKNAADMPLVFADESDVRIITRTNFGSW